MSAYEVPQPILNSPFEEPKEHWHIVEGETPEQRAGRRPSMYFYRDPKVKPEKEYGAVAGTAIELKLVNRIRAQVEEVAIGWLPGRDENDPRAVAVVAARWASAASVFRTTRFG